MKNVERYLKVRFIRCGNKPSPATKTYVNKIPEEDFNAILKWFYYGELLWGRLRKRVYINIISQNKEAE